MTRVFPKPEFETRIRVCVYALRARARARAHMSVCFRLSLLYEEKSFSHALFVSFFSAQFANLFAVTAGL